MSADRIDRMVGKEYCAPSKVHIYVRKKHPDNGQGDSCTHVSAGLNTDKGNVSGQGVFTSDWTIWYQTFQRTVTVSPTFSCLQEVLLYARDFSSQHNHPVRSQTGWFTNGNIIEESPKLTFTTSHALCVCVSVHFASMFECSECKHSAAFTFLCVSAGMIEA